MKFIELTAHTTTEGSELVADIFWNYTNKRARKNFHYIIHAHHLI